MTINEKINSIQPENLKKVICSGKRVEDRRLCILKRKSCRKLRLKSPEKMEVKTRVIMGNTERAKDLVIMAMGSKNQMSWAENIAPTRRKKSI
jgi:hypothetical protein